MERRPVLDFEGKVKLRQVKHGFMFYLPHDVYIGKALDFYGEYGGIEGELFEAIIKPGMTVVEVGANIGCHTVHLAQLVTSGGRVVAFEPQRTLFYFLAANLVGCGCPWIDAYNAAISDKPGLLGVPNVDYSKEGNFGGISLEGDKGGTQMVQATTLDSFSMVNCHFLKVDVEGMEYEVLAGGEATIKRCRPIIYIENDRKDKSQRLIQKLFELGYGCFWHTPRLFNPKNYFEQKVNIYGNTVSVNMLCIPHEFADKCKVDGLKKVETAKDWWQ